MLGKPKYYLTKAAIAKSEQVSLTTVGRWMLKDDFPARRKNGWLMAEVKSWRSGLQEDRSARGNGHDPSYAKVRHDLDRAKLELQRHKLAVLTQEYMRRRDAEEACLDIAHAFKRGHEEMIDALSLELGGLDPPQIAEKLTERFRRLHESVAAQIVAAMQRK